MTSDWFGARRLELDRLFDARLSPPDDGDPGRLLEAMDLFTVWFGAPPDAVPEPGLR